MTKQNGFISTLNTRRFGVPPYVEFSGVNYSPDGYVVIDDASIERESNDGKFIKVRNRRTGRCRWLDRGLVAADSEVQSVKCPGPGRFVALPFGRDRMRK